MGNFRSKLAALGLFAATAALSALAAGEAAAQTTPLRLNELGCQGNVSSSARGNWTPAYQSARSNIQSAAATAASTGVPLDEANMRRVTEALAECEPGLRANNRYGADAHMCVAAARVVLAQQGQNPETNLQDAICRYATLALVADRNNRPYAAAANRGLGDALQARHKLGGNTAYLDQAIHAYNIALVRQPVTNPAQPGTHTTLAALARAHSARNNPTEADAVYGRLLDLRPETTAEFTTADRAAAYAARARLSGRDVAERQRFWAESMRLAQSGEAAVELGRLQLPTDSTSARANFTTAASRAWPQSPTGVNYQLEGSYFLSLTESPAWSENARPLRSDWNAAWGFAEAAGTSQPHYRRQACLSHIGRGGDDYSSRHLTSRNTPAEFAADRAQDENRGRVCTGGAGDAEGQLLAGMYWLRRAQYNLRIDNEAWRGFLLNAERAFREAGQAATGANNIELPWLDRRGQFVTINGSRPRIADVIAAGAAVTNYMQRLCPTTTPPDNSQLYAFYDVQVCYPRGQ